MKELNTDVIIIGGGISGLWLLNHLHHHGYQAFLFEQNKLGGGQTIASQGIIHGGLKYALSGMLNKSSEAIAAMPNYWSDCLTGSGNIDLKQAKILSDHVLLWSTDTITSKLKSFFSSKMLRSRVTSAPVKNSFFDNEQFNGQLYQLNEMVLDIHSIIKNLTDNYRDYIYKIDWERAQIHSNKQNKFTHITLQDAEQNVQIKANAVILTAGEGNESLVNKFGIKKSTMQRRPLHQVIMKHKLSAPLFAHCIGQGTSSSPRLTITTHQHQDGDSIWYLGGDIATNGISMSSEEVIAAAQQELATLLPWVNLDNAQWASFAINRAEAQQDNFLKPDTAYVKPLDSLSNVTLAWPTKLTLAPDLADQVLKLLRDQNIRPHELPLDKGLLDEVKTILPTPEIAKPIWDELF